MCLTQYVTTINAHTLAFCSSENAAIGVKLGLSPNMIGLDDNIFVSEVVIKDDNAYMNVVLNADGGSW